MIPVCVDDTRAYGMPANPAGAIVDSSMVLSTTRPGAARAGLPTIDVPSHRAPSLPGWVVVHTVPSDVWSDNTWWQPC